MRVRRMSPPGLALLALMTIAGGLLATPTFGAAQTAQFQDGFVPVLLRNLIRLDFRGFLSRSRQSESSVA